MRRATFLLIIVLVLAAACSPAATPTSTPAATATREPTHLPMTVGPLGIPPTPSPAPAIARDTNEETGASDLSGATSEREAGPLAPPSSGEGSAVGGVGGGDAVAAAPMVEAPAGEMAVGSESLAAPGYALSNQAVIAMNAGEIDDNAEWDTYLTYRHDFLQSGIPVHDVDVTGRHIIRVADGQGQPVLGARVRVYAGDTVVSDTRTFANGETLFFPNANSSAPQVDSWHVTVEKGSASTAFELDPSSGSHTWDATLDVARSDGPVRLDVLFLIDSTGSMADEIMQLQSNILSISSQISALGDTDVRFGMVAYRDRGDDYITRVYDFVPDVTDFQAELNQVQADGGGDTPESLNAGLHDAIQSVEWRVEDTISIVILVADAPPHLDYAQDYDYAQEMVEADRKGIKIYPIASSGLDAQGEYIFRQLAQYTMGHFLFLTYAGGVPGAPGEDRPDLAAGSEDYTVDSLDQLVVRLITDEIGAYLGTDMATPEAQ